MKTPQTFADVLSLAKLADCVSWHRDTKTLNLILDDKSIDRRYCVDLRIDRLAVAIRTLKDFDAKKDRWGDYDGGPRHVTLPDKKGQKALLAWLAERATEIAGYPNPANFSIYRTPAQVAAASAFALTAA